MLISPSIQPSSGKAQLILDGWPVVVLRIETGVTLADIEPIFERYEKEVFARKEPFVSMTDLRGISSVPDASFRTRMGEWSREGDAAMRAFSIGNVTIFSSKLIRGAVTAIFWVYQPPIPQAVAGEWGEGVDWCVQALADRDVDITHMSKLALRRDPLAYRITG